jgi:hypothetical protein
LQRQQWRIVPEKSKNICSMMRNIAITGMIQAQDHSRDLVGSIIIVHEFVA